VEQRKCRRAVCRWPPLDYSQGDGCGGQCQLGLDAAHGDHTLRPSVTINQAVGQADPANAGPINFTVVFNESPAGTFATGDVSFAGSTAGGTLVGTVSGGSTTFNVAVTGMTTAGTVIASVPAGVATDTAGNANVASTSTDNTVTYQPCVAPSVTANPISQTVTYGAASVSFSAAASGTPAPTVQWQVSTNGGGSFSDIGGATSTTLTISTPTVAMSGNQYRAVFTNTCGGTQTASSSAATLTVNRAHLTVKADDKSKTYDNAAYSPFTATITGFVNSETMAVVSGSPSFSGTAVGAVDFGTYTITPGLGSLSAANYDFTPFQDGTLTISKASSTTTVTGGTFTFDNSPHAATVSVAGAGGLSLNPTPTYSGGCSVAPTHVSETTPTACTASYSFAGDTNHDPSSGSATIVINKAPSSTVVTGGTFTFDNSPHAATVSVAGAGGLSLNPTPTCSGGCSVAPTHVSETTPTACTASYSFAGDLDHTGSSDSAIITITQAPSVTVVSGGSSFQFDGLAHGATVSVTGAGGLSLTPLPSDTACVTAPVHVAQTPCTASYSFAGDLDHTGSSDSAIITITQAPSVTTIGAGYAVIYNTLPHGVTANVTGAGGLNQAVAVVYVPGSSTVPVNPGSYSASATYPGDTDHTGSTSATVTITITYGVCSAGSGPGGVILPPINSDGTSVYNRKGGSTIPVKFTVCDAFGNPISNPAAVFAGTGGSLTMLNEVRGTITVVNETATNDIPDVAFRWTGNQWIFNMATTNLAQGSTYTFRINLAYGSISFVVGVK
jgi:MBG domain (YGX type)